MAPLEPRLLDVADRFLEMIGRETSYRAIICDETAHIVRASARERIGDLHAGAKRILAGESSEVAVTAAEALANPRMKEGVSCPIVVDGRRLGTFGITGHPERVQPIARMAALILGNWLEELQRLEIASSLERAHRTRRPRVLCVDDSLVWRERAQRILSDDCDLVPACDGVEGLRAAKADPPDVVLSDFEMPGLNGLQLLLAMRSDPALRVIPVIIVTAVARGVTSQLLEAGAHDFLLKSSEPEELKVRVRAALRCAQVQEQVRLERQELSRIGALFSRSEARTRAIVESSIDAIVLLGADGSIQGLNAAGEAMFGSLQREVVGLPFLELLVADRSRPAVAECLAKRGGRPAHGAQAGRQETFGLRRGGTEFPIECHIRPLSTGSAAEMCAFVRDLSDARQMEMELEQARKLEAVGRLAAGVAHEINTPIQYIGDNATFVGEALAGMNRLLDGYIQAASPETRAALRGIEQEVDLEYLRDHAPQAIAKTLEGVQRVATIVRSMKEFAHPDQKSMIATDLNRALRATLEVARNEYKCVADVEVELGELPLVTCHAGDLNQVFLNIVVNAAHAVADSVRDTGKKGHIRVTTKREGEDVLIAIADTGLGIPEEVRGRIFDPFFTTKEVGRGTGQGLSIARKIVASHQGTLSFTTEVGRGTTFLVRLPIERSTMR
ncbi:MAG: ATP-binding protein [Myxococcales bacterium]